MPDNPSQDRDDDLEQLAKQRRPSMFREFWGFLRHNKKWWMLPLLVMLLLLGILILLGGTAVAPFLYPLF